MWMLQDVLAGATSSLVVAPFMMVIDASIVKTQFEKRHLAPTLRSTVKGFVNGSLPWRQPWQVMVGVYASTYITANTVEGVCKQCHIDYKIPTTLCTSIVNMTAIAYKDRMFAQWFGVISNSHSLHFSARSYGLFAVRDMMTIASSFVLKKNVQSYLEAEHGVHPTWADAGASFVVPMSAQLVSTPLHILAMDLYQRPRETMASRWALIKNQYSSVCAGRMLRVLPAFGLGGFINDMLQKL